MEELLRGKRRTASQVERKSRSYDIRARVAAAVFHFSFTNSSYARHSARSCKESADAASLGHSGACGVLHALESEGSLGFHELNILN